MEYMLTFHILNVYVDKTQPHQFKYTFKHLSVCHCSQSTGRNSYSIVSRDVSDCSYRLSFIPLMSSHLSSAKHILYRVKNTQKLS